MASEPVTGQPNSPVNQSIMSFCKNIQEKGKKMSNLSFVHGVFHPSERTELHLFQVLICHYFVDSFNLEESKICCLVIG